MQIKSVPCHLIEDLLLLLSDLWFFYNLFNHFLIECCLLLHFNPYLRRLFRKSTFPVWLLFMELISEQQLHSLLNIEIGLL